MVTIHSSHGTVSVDLTENGLKNLLEAGTITPVGDGTYTLTAKGEEDAGAHFRRMQAQQSGLVNLEFEDGQGKRYTLY